MNYPANIPLGPGELTEANLIAAVIYGPGHEKVGAVAYLDGSGPITKVVIDVRGFMGIGAKPVAIAISDLRFMRDKHGTVHATTAITPMEAKSLPEHRH